MATHGQGEVLLKEIKKSISNFEEILDHLERDLFRFNMGLLPTNLKAHFERNFGQFKDWQLIPATLILKDPGSEVEEADGLHMKLSRHRRIFEVGGQAVDSLIDRVSAKRVIVHVDEPLEEGAWLRVTDWYFKAGATSVQFVREPGQFAVR